MSHLFTLPHLFILLDGLAGVLVMLNFVLPKEHYENANLLLRRLLARLGSDHLILLALATWFVVSAGVVGHAIYKDVVNNSFVSELYSARTMMTIIGIALGTAPVALIWKTLPELTRPNESRDRRLGTVIIIVSIAMIVAAVAVRVGIPTMPQTWLTIWDLMLGAALGAGLFQCILTIITSLRVILYREKDGLIMAGLMWFVLTRYFELLYT
jgi:hypothetical protein